MQTRWRDEEEEMKVVDDNMGSPSKMKMAKETLKDFGVFKEEKACRARSMSESKQSTR